MLRNLLGMRKGADPPIGKPSTGEVTGAPLADRPVVRIPVHRIAVSEHNMRPASELSPESLAPLCETMRAVGLLQPIIVRPAGGTLEVIAGRRRLEAAKLLGWAAIDAIIIDESSGDFSFHIENEQREDLHPIVRAWSKQKHADETGKSQAELATIFGCTRTEVADDLAIAWLPEDIREEALDLGKKVSRSQLVEVARCNEAHRQKQLWQQVKRGLSRDEVRAARGQAQQPLRSIRRSLRASVKGVSVIADRVSRLALSAELSSEDRDLLLELQSAVADLARLIAEVEHRPASHTLVA